MSSEEEESGNSQRWTSGVKCIHWPLVVETFRFRAFRAFLGQRRRDKIGPSARKHLNVH